MPRVLLLTLLAVIIQWQIPAYLWADAKAPGQPLCTPDPECSTERVNGNCRITVDRLYPIQLPSIQLRPGKKATVCVVNPLPYESLSLDANPGALQAVAGTDQIAGFLNSAFSDLGKIVVANDPNYIGGKLLTSSLLPQLQQQAQVRQDLQQLETMLDQAYCTVDTTFRQTAAVYAQLLEVVAPLPRPLIVSARPSNTGIPANTPFPWSVDSTQTPPVSRYPAWRTLLLGELTGTPQAGTTIKQQLGCDQVGAAPAPVPVRQTAPPQNFKNLVWALNTLSTEWNCPAGTPCTLRNTDLIDEAAFNTLAIKTRSDIAPLGAAGTGFSNLLDTYVKTENSFRTELPGYYLKQIQSADTDLAQNYVPNIVSSSRDITPPVPQNLGEILDPAVSHVNSINTKFLGRTVSFSVNAVNQIATGPASSAASAKKAAVTIAVLFADPIFEVSSGVFFSTLASRTFANQTVVGPSATNPSTQVSTEVRIAETSTVPTVLPFVAANWRLKDFHTSRRMALYATTAIALSAYNSSAEYAGGLSISWRSLMFSVLGHAGRVVNLSQGEYKNEVWCTYGTSGANACSGSTAQPYPTAPSTTHDWTGAVAFGISVRVPTLYGGAGH